MEMIVVPRSVIDAATKQHMITEGRYFTVDGQFSSVQVSKPGAVDTTYEV